MPCRFSHSTLDRPIPAAGGDPQIRRPDGARVEAPPVEVEGDALEVLRLRHERAGLEIDERSLPPAWDGTPPDYGVAVQALLQ